MSSALPLGSVHVSSSKNNKMLSPTLLSSPLCCSLCLYLLVFLEVRGCTSGILGIGTELWFCFKHNITTTGGKEEALGKADPCQQNKAELCRIACRTRCTLLPRRGHEKHKYSISSSSPSSWFSFSAPSVHPLLTSSTVSPFSQAGQCVRVNLCTKTKRRSDLITCQQDDTDMNWHDASGCLRFNGWKESIIASDVLLQRCTSGRKHAVITLTF